MIKMQRFKEERSIALKVILKYISHVWMRIYINITRAEFVKAV